MNFEQLAALAPGALTERLGQLLSTERGIVVEFLAHLAEVDRRKLHLAEGYPSLFAYCTQRLRLSKAAAFRRTTAARLLTRFPDVGDYLADGRLCLTTLVELRDVLTEENSAAVLERAQGMTEDEVRLLVVTLCPQEAPAPMLRRLPAANAVAPAASHADAVSSGPEPTSPALPPPRRDARLDPIAPDLHVLRVAVGREFVDDLARAKAALSHQIPGGDLAQVLHACVRLALAATDKRHGITAAPRTQTIDTPKGRHIPAAVRRAVWTRDGGRCTFVGAGGHRCYATHQVELHHLQPFAMGGPPTVTNLTLRCRAHNAYAAEQDFGPPDRQASLW